MPGKDFVLRIIEEIISNPKELLRCSQSFHVVEPRNIDFFVAEFFAREYRESRAGPEFLLKGMVYLLMEWNAVWYRMNWRVNEQARMAEQLYKRLEEAYDNVRGDLAMLSSASLLGADLDDPELVEAIKRVFREFLFEEGETHPRRRHYTGASKALHLANPYLFVMWDSNIREAYHKLHKDRDHDITDCYIEFLKDTQKIIRKLLDKTSEGRLWEEHREQMPLEPRRLAETLNIKETPLKLIDECNYIIFTKRRQIP